MAAPRRRHDDIGDHQVSAVTASMSRAQLSNTGSNNAPSARYTQGRRTVQEEQFEDESTPRTLPGSKEPGDKHRIVVQTDYVWFGLYPATQYLRKIRDDELDRTFEMKKARSPVGEGEGVAVFKPDRRAFNRTDMYILLSGTVFQGSPGNMLPEFKKGKPEISPGEISGLNRTITEYLARAFGAIRVQPEREPSNYALQTSNALQQHSGKIDHRHQARRDSEPPERANQYLSSATTPVHDKMQGMEARHEPFRDDKRRQSVKKARQHSNYHSGRSNKEDEYLESGHASGPPGSTLDQAARIVQVLLYDRNTASKRVAVQHEDDYCRSCEEFLKSVQEALIKFGASLRSLDKNPLSTDQLDRYARLNNNTVDVKIVHGLLVHRTSARIDSMTDYSFIHPDLVDKLGLEVTRLPPESDSEFACVKGRFYAVGEIEIDLEWTGKDGGRKSTEWKFLVPDEWEVEIDLLVAVVDAERIGLARDAYPLPAGKIVAPGPTYILKRSAGDKKKDKVSNNQTKAKNRNTEAWLQQRQQSQANSQVSTPSSHSGGTGRHS